MRVKLIDGKKDGDGRTLHEENEVVEVSEKHGQLLIREGMAVDLLEEALAVDPETQEKKPKQKKTK